MTYTLEQMLIFLLFAGISGYLLCRLLEARRNAAWAASCRSSFDRAEAARVAAEAEVATLRDARDAAEARARELRDRLAAAERDQSRLREERDAFRRRADAAEARPRLPLSRAPIPRPKLPPADARSGAAVGDEERDVARETERAVDTETADAPAVESASSEPPSTPASEPVSEPVRSGAVPATRAVARRSGIALPSRFRLRNLPPADDLLRIRGVGPSTARKLRQMGYRTYEDVMGWTDDDVARLRGELGAPGSRIDRDDWRGQARRLAEKKGLSARTGLSAEETRD